MPRRIAPRPCRTCVHAATHCSTTLPHVRPCRDALHHDLAARAPMTRRIAPRPCCTCAHAATHCSATLLHVRPCRGALQRDPAARAPMPWRIAARPCRTCAHAVAHCSATLLHVRPCRDALLHALSYVVSRRDSGIHATRLPPIPLHRPPQPLLEGRLRAESELALRS